ncbi:MAG: hypothetical protein JW982_08070 [Spirochaetes bacterium]|nr:hypothetical protein [Spirochaetota bacterium]
MKKLFISVLLVFSSTIMFAQDKMPSDSIEPTAKKTVTLFIPLKCDGLTKEEENRINSDLYLRFSADKNINLLKISSSSISPAGTLNEAVRTGLRYNADRVIYGNVTSTEIKDQKALDDQGADQYILVETENRNYKISVYAADVKSKRNEKSYVKALVKKNTSPAAAAISGYFKQKPDRLPEQTVGIPEKQEDITVSEDKPENSYIWSAALSMSCQAPILNFSDITAFNAGIAGYGRVDNVFFDNLVLTLKFYAAYSISHENYINDYLNYAAAFSTGYRFYLPAGFELVPQISTGIITHYVNAEQGSGSYRDTVASAGMDIIFRLNDSGGIFLSPSYNLFFEKTYTGHFISIDLGYEYRFNSKK